MFIKPEANPTMHIPHNFLPGQYARDNSRVINHTYLRAQFEDYEKIFAKLKTLVIEGDFTLGQHVDEFERRICAMLGSRYCLGVGSGTDALLLSLKAAGVREGDEIITTPFTFFATIGAIVTAGARPVFVDIGDDFNIDADKIEAASTPRTKGILPVHWSGLPCRMDKIGEIARRRNLFIVEDACHAIQATFHGKHAGTFGLTGCFSLHPLKNLNVWGDGGYLVTDSEEMHEKLALLRNHGLINRNECAVFAYNSRLDSLQAIVANHLLDKLDHITASRIRNALHFDHVLAGLPQVRTPARDANIKQVHHLYCLRVERRDELQKHLLSLDIDAKVHYPIPMHLQPAAKEFGHQRGDFPQAERASDTELSLPVHEFITPEHVEFVGAAIRKFYGAV
jgi:dTDP-4-amino-4,6-dideoxygalactose transaminase